MADQGRVKFSLGSGNYLFEIKNQHQLAAFIFSSNCLKIQSGRLILFRFNVFAKPGVIRD